MPGQTAEFETLAASLWARSCAEQGVDPADPRLVSGMQMCLAESDDLAAAGAPSGSDGVRWLADQYLAQLPRNLRAKHGRFYTPGALAGILAGQALRLSGTDGPIVDPACGGGSLLAAVVDRIVSEREPGEAVRFVLENVRGTDLDPVAVSVCDLAVRTALLPAWAALPESSRPTLRPFAVVGDGLSDERTATLVIANPPFGRVSGGDRVRARHGRVLYGHAHWPTIFLHSAVSRLASGGVAAFVLPASFVGGMYFSRLRAFLIETAPPAWLGFIDERAGVFQGGVLQEALLVTFQRDRVAAEVRIQRIGGGGSLGTSHSASIAHWQAGKPWLIARQESDIALVDVARRRSKRLADYGWRISTGPLVWNRHRAQLGDTATRASLPVIWASDLRDGRVVVVNRPSRFIEPYPNQEWLVLSRPAVLVQRTTAPEQPRRLVAGVLDEATLEALGGRVVVENHLNVCTWDGTGPLNHELLLSYLMSDEADRLYRCMSGSVAVSAFELGELPMPEIVDDLVGIA